MSKKDVSAKKLSKKEARQSVYNRLVVALAEFKTGIKDKKFESSLRKASRLFADDYAKAINKEMTRISKQNKKAPKAKTTAKPETLMVD